MFLLHCGNHLTFCYHRPTNGSITMTPRPSDDPSIVYFGPYHNYYCICHYYSDTFIRDTTM